MSKDSLQTIKRKHSSSYSKTFFLLSSCVLLWNFYLNAFVRIYVCVRIYAYLTLLYVFCNAVTGFVASRYCASLFPFTYITIIIVISTFFFLYSSLFVNDPWTLCREKEYIYFYVERTMCVKETNSCIHKYRHSDLYNKELFTHGTHIHL